MVFGKIRCQQKGSMPGERESPTHTGGPSFFTLTGLRHSRHKSGVYADGNRNQKGVQKDAKIDQRFIHQKEVGVWK